MASILSWPQCVKGLLVVYVSSIDWTDWSRTLTGHGIYRTPQFNGRLNLNGESRWIWFRPLLRHDMEVNDFCIIGPLWGESSSDWWIPLARDQLCVIRRFGVFCCYCLFCFLLLLFFCYLSEQTVEQTDKQSILRWFETPCRRCDWRPCNVNLPCVSSLPCVHNTQRLIN